MRVLHWDGRSERVLADDAVVADSFHRRLRGLMFRSPLQHGEGMAFRFDGAASRSVHTLFVRAPIDVIWIVRERVTKVTTLHPWTLRCAGRCDTIVELPAGGASDVSADDRVRLAR